MSIVRNFSAKVLLALLAVLACAVLWYKRLHVGDEVAPPPAPPVAASAAAPSPTFVAGAVAPVLTTINWADPGDPRAIPLNRENYLLDTSDGLQVWDSDKLKLSALHALPAHARLLDQVWMPAKIGPHNGTLFVVREPQSATLVLVRDDHWTVERRLALPADFMPDALVRLGDDVALLCAPDAGRSIVVGISGGELTLRSEADFMPQALGMFQRAAVVGPVMGFADQKELAVDGDGATRQPLLFDTRTCRWRARALPEPMASGMELTLSVRMNVRMNYSGPAIVAARWRDPLSKEARTLQVPLVWNGTNRQWWQRKAADLPGVPPAALAGVIEGDWSFAASASDGRFAFLSGVDDRWREATQRLPAHDKFKLLYTRNEGVLVLLISAQQPGRVVRIAPSARTPEFRSSMSAVDNVVPLGHGALLVLEGAASKVSIIRPDVPKAAPVASLPQAQRHSSGVALADGSVLVFGGLDPRCDPSAQTVCARRTATGVRWIPGEQRWQSLDTLAVPYAHGESLDGGSTPLYSPYGRSDFVALGNALFYLSGNAIKWAGYPRAEASRLYRWQLGGKSEALAQTRLNRSDATLIELNDGRLAVLGGAAADEAPTPACASCRNLRREAVRRMAASIARNAQADKVDDGDDDDGNLQNQAEAAVPECPACQTTSVGEGYASARSCELYEHAGNRWSFGPWANHAGGRAVKLANGRIFKFGLLGHNTTDAGYAAETADPALAGWTVAPPFPLPRPTAVKAMQVVGNQVLLVMETPGDRLVLWDDASRSWQVRPLPQHASWSLHTMPHLVSGGGGSQLLMIYNDSFEYLDWPFH